jgi:phenylacetate-CoA ligase
MTFIHRRFIYPGVALAIGEGAMFRRLRALTSLQYQPASFLEQYQAERLSRLFARAATTPYYASLFGPGRPPTGATSSEILNGLPLLTKRDVQRSLSELRVTPQPTRLSHKVTGGSTGEAVTILKDRTATAYERAAMWLGYSWHGIRIGDRAARFWGQPFGKRSRITTGLTDLAMNRIRFSAFAFDEQSLESYWRRCLQFRPEYFHGYVSMLVEFAQFVQSTGKDGSALRLKCIIATSEVLLPTQRTLLESVFGCSVLVEYGCGELGPIAYNCEAGTLHLLTPDVHVEFLRDDGTAAEIGETARLILSDLNNSAITLLRYEIGDFGVRGSGCTCGRGLPTLAKIWGRAYDVVLAPSGKRYHGEFFMYIFEDLRRSGLSISQFQVIQLDDRQLLFRVIAEPEYRPRIAEQLQRAVDHHLPGMTLELGWVDMIPRLPSGKMQVIENRILRSAQSSPA